MKKAPLPSRGFSCGCDGHDPVLSVMGLVNVKLFWYGNLKGLQ